MDIGSGEGYPEASLSNFAPHPFEIDGVQCASMEGFLQSLKFKDPEMQRHVCTLVGKTAKFKGKRKKWWQTQTLYWQGVEYKRESEEYQALLDRAFEALSRNSGFARALLATGNATLTHSIGKRKKTETVLTISEFCSRLTAIRHFTLVKIPKTAEPIIGTFVEELTPEGADTRRSISCERYKTRSGVYYIELTETTAHRNTTAQGTQPEYGKPTYEWWQFRLDDVNMPSKADIIAMFTSLAPTLRALPITTTDTKPEKAT
ncbi:unnamed protein product [Cylicocyclus nassatus]|uniref:Uncharacterized protein n=1 Tax=Cylicocyclus nassatus TaxID=53992 RepID=A0AA36HIS3_CYLNA|nr:unnamed protein product [Cylicocyclus nassatus]